MNALNGKTSVRSSWRQPLLSVANVFMSRRKVKIPKSWRNLPKLLLFIRYIHVLIFIIFNDEHFSNFLFKRICAKRHSFRRPCVLLICFGSIYWHIVTVISFWKVREIGQIREFLPILSMQGFCIGTLISFLPVKKVVIFRFQANSRLKFVIIFFARIYTKKNNKRERNSLF